MYRKHLEINSITCFMCYHTNTVEITYILLYIIYSVELKF